MWQLFCIWLFTQHPASIRGKEAATLQCWVCRVCRVYWCTWSKQPPAVLLGCGTLAIVAVALGLVVAGFAVHLEAVVGTVLRRSRAVFRQVAFTGRRSAHTSCLFQLQVEEKKSTTTNNKQRNQGVWGECHSIAQFIIGLCISHHWLNLLASAWLNQGCDQKFNKKNSKCLFFLGHHILYTVAIAAPCTFIMHMEQQQCVFLPCSITVNDSKASNS